MGKNKNDLRLHMRFIINYKKNTLAIFFSFVLTLMLLTTMLILLHTNHRIENIQYKTVFTPSDCYIKGLSKHQIEQLKKDKTIEQLAVEQETYNESYIRNNQNLHIAKGDETYITMMAVLIEGRMPEKDGEIVAEKWVLLNLGIEPKVGQSFVIYDSETGIPKKLELVGILSDMSGNKKYGTITLYTTLNKQSEGFYHAYLKLKDNINYDIKMNSLLTELGIEKKQIKKCPAKEDFKSLYETDIKVVICILVICMVVFYGVYRIAFITREKQYGVFRAVGMDNKQLRTMLLLELYEIYLVSVPIGIGIGFMLAYFIMRLSGDRNIKVYLYNQMVRFNLVIPVLPILFCAMLVAILIGFIGYKASKKIIIKSVIETISGISHNKAENRILFGFGNSNSKISTLFQMGCKYIVKDIRASSLAILTICVGVTLFTSLSYKAKLLRLYREDTKEMLYLNGDYAMTMQNFYSTKQGISRKSLEAIKKIHDVTTIKTESGIPIRVIDEDNVRRNDAYYNDLNARVKKYYGYENAGNDGINQVYKSVLYGYNTNALQDLKKYVISGDYDIDDIKEDEVILSILSMDTSTKDNKIPGNYKVGTPLMQYKVGDEIQIKYRADLNTDSYAYESFTDRDVEYKYKNYKIAAIVSFNYMFDCKRTVYPLFITSDQHIQKIAPDSRLQGMYVNGKEGMTLTQQINLEQQLIRICNQNNNVSTRSMISEMKQNEMFYHKQMIYIYGIAVVAFVLVLINIINNLTYRMQTRTREICMLRAIGMSVAMTKKMIFFENMIIGIIAVTASFVLSQPAIWYLYQASDMKAFGHPFQYDYVAYIGVSSAALLICALLSFRIVKSWRIEQIVEGINNLE